MSPLFGPVKSRRLGLSLGLELVPKKICSMDCLYCEVGKTEVLTLERKAYYSWEKIERAIFEAKDKESEYDVLTLTGSGEPTLNIYFEKAVELAKALISKPVCILTNSSTVNIPSVREALAKADLVLASLDSASERSFRVVNRPLAEINLREIIFGLKKLREEMEGELWLEVLLVKGINDKKEDLMALKEAIEIIKPHRTQLNTVVRPPAYSIAKALSSEELEEVKNFLGERVEVIVPQNWEGRVAHPPSLQRASSEGDVESLLREYLLRRPAPLEELISLFSFERDLQLVLEKMVKDGKIKKVFHQGEIFYIA